MMNKTNKIKIIALKFNSLLNLKNDSEIYDKIQRLHIQVLTKTPTPQYDSALYICSLCLKLQQIIKIKFNS